MPVSANRKIAGFSTLCLIWGTTWLTIKIGLEGVPPFLGVGLRFVLAGSILLVIAIVRNRKLNYSKELLRISLIIGILLFTFSYGAVYWAEQYISSGLASVLFATMPLFVALFARIILKNELLNTTRLVGMFIGIGGTALIFSETVGISNLNEFRGLIVTMMSPITAAIAVVLTKKHIHNHDPFFLNGWSMLLGGLVTLSIHFAYGSPYPLVWNTASVGALLYLTLVGSALAFGIYFWMLQHMEATTVSFVTLISPVIAVFIGAIVLSESLTGLQIVGSIFVLSGVLLSEIVSKKIRRN